MISWEEIESIEYIDAEGDYVYDFSVDETETFSTADGLVVHNTLNTFHAAGISSKSKVNQGVPRIRELISVSKNFKTPSATIFLNEEHNTKENALKVLHMLESINFDYFVDNSSIWYSPLSCNEDSSIQCEEPDQEFVREYYEYWDDGVGMEHLSPWVLRIELNPLYLINKGMTMFEMYFFLTHKYEKKKLHIIYSDENAEHNVIHFRFIHSNANAITETETGEKIPCTNSDLDLLTRLEKELTSNCLVRGIKNVSKVTMREISVKQVVDTEVQSKKQIVLDTAGTNLMEILQDITHLDTQRTVSNDIHEIYETLGVEAARQMLKDEIYEVLDKSGVYVNSCHVDLLVDSMTLNGGLISMNRYGISKTDNGIISMASFEEPHGHFSTGAVHNISDNMNSAISNILMGQPGKFGTGMVDVVFDADKFKKHMRPRLGPIHERDGDEVIVDFGM